MFTFSFGFVLPHHGGRSKVMLRDCRGRHLNGSGTGCDNSGAVYELEHHGAHKVSLRNVATGKLLCIEQNNVPVVNRDNVGDWEKLEVIHHGDGSVSFRSAHGRYICSEDNRVIADRTAIGEWEHWRIVPASNRVVLRDHKGRFLSGASTVGLASGVGANEVFEISSHGGDKIALRNVNNHKLICFEPSSIPVCNRDNVGEWEQVHVVNNGDGTISLRSCHGKHLCAEDNGRVIADRANIGAWEKFHLIYV